jgi:hypothetical protein
MKVCGLSHERVLPTGPEPLQPALWTRFSAFEIPNLAWGIMKDRVGVADVCRRPHRPHVPHGRDSSGFYQGPGQNAKASRVSM